MPDSNPFRDAPELPDEDAERMAATTAEERRQDFPPAKEANSATRKPATTARPKRAMKKKSEPQAEIAMRETFFHGVKPIEHEEDEAEVVPMQFISLLDASNLPYMEYVVKGWIPLFGVGQIFGDPACYKSFTTLSLCIHISEGWDFCGHKVKKRPVYYLQLEGAGGLSKRLQAFMKWMREAEKPQLSGVFRFWTNNFPILNKTARESLIAGIKADCATTGMEGAVIVIDTQSQAAIGAGENTDNMAAVIGHARDIAAAVNGVCILIHHCGKTTKGDSRTKTPRGHSTQIGNVDFSILAEKKGKGVALWTSTKEKEDADDQTIGFKIHVFPVGTDSDGDPVTSCVAVPETDLSEDEQKTLQTIATKAKRPKLTKRGQFAWKVFNDVISEHGHDGYLDATTYREAFMSRFEPSSDDPKKAAGNARKAYSDTMQELQSAGLIRKTKDGRLQNLQRD